MKILITTDLYTTDTNGVVTSVKNLFDELKSKGHDVRILTLSERMRSYREGAVTYIRSMPLGIYPNVRMPLSYRHPLIQELIDWKPDVIHSQCEFFSFQYALRLAKHIKAPIVHTYHTMYEQYVTYVIPYRPLGRWVIRKFVKNRLKRVATVIAPTFKVEQSLLGYGMKNAIRVIPSGISLEQHSHPLSPEERMEKRKALGIAPRGQVLINLGRLGTEKNVTELLDFFANALKEDPTLVFLIVGDGPAKAGLEKQTARLGIAHRVLFTGMVDPATVGDYYQLGDLFVSASTSETQGLTYVEAAANGLPLLCRQDPCLKGVIAQGENGYEYTNEEEFLHALHQITKDTQWRKSAEKKSREIAAAFDKEAFGNAVEEVYTSVL